LFAKSCLHDDPNSYCVGDTVIRDSCPGWDMYYGVAVVINRRALAKAEDINNLALTEGCIKDDLQPSSLKILKNVLIL